MISKINIILSCIVWGNKRADESYLDWSLREGRSYSKATYAKVDQVWCVTGRLTLLVPMLQNLVIEHLTYAARNAYVYLVIIP